VTSVCTFAPASPHVDRTLVITAVTSSALWSRLAAGLNSVTSPVPIGMATAGQAERMAVMPP
jgi:hypothetical protein